MRNRVGKSPKIYFIPISIWKELIRLKRSHKLILSGWRDQLTYKMHQKIKSCYILYNFPISIRYNSELSENSVRSNLEVTNQACLEQFCCSVPGCGVWLACSAGGCIEESADSGVYRVSSSREHPSYETYYKLFICP